MKTSELTMENRLKLGGIKTIYPANFMFSRKEKRWGEIILEYKGKKVVRPNAQSCVSVCKKHFNLDI